jgi:hypothetical protein
VGDGGASCSDDPATPASSSAKRASTDEAESNIVFRSTLANERSRVKVDEGGAVGVEGGAVDVDPSKRVGPPFCLTATGGEGAVSCGIAGEALPSTSAGTG